MDAAPDDAMLERLLDAVESRLETLGEALRGSDAPAVEREAEGLHAALGAAVDAFADAARRGPLEPALRRRLARLGGRIAAQRESVARATAALDRAIEVLLPGAREPAWGAAPRGPRGGISA